jgi:hypothetical protein
MGMPGQAVYAATNAALRFCTMTHIQYQSPTFENFHKGTLANATLKYPSPTLQYTPSLPLDQSERS